MCSKSLRLATTREADYSVITFFFAGTGFTGAEPGGFSAGYASASFASLASSFLYSKGSHVKVNSNLPFGSAPKSQRSACIFVVGGSHLLLPSNFT